MDESGYVRGDTDKVNPTLDGDIQSPNVLAVTPPAATREDGAVMLYSLCLEALPATHWNIRVLEIAED